jgi:uncharacterized cupin superfamily protein
MEWDAELPAPSSLRARRVGAHAGAKRLGATLYEIDPGGAISPYHVHHANEELLFVVAGSPSVRTPDGVQSLGPGDTLSFPAGPDGAHRVFNASEEPVQVLLVSTMVFPEVAEHVTTGITLAMTSRTDGKVFPPGTDIATSDALRRSMAADAEADGG